MAAPSDFFAPELFQPNDDLMRQRTNSTSFGVDGFSVMPEVPRRDSEMTNLDAGYNAFDGQFELNTQLTGMSDGAFDESQQMTMDTDLTMQDAELPVAAMEDGAENNLPTPSSSRRKSTNSKRGKRERTEDGEDQPKKPSKHSSKNEGQHTDKRYLCYVCDKLFTRRRSVRDHISKIHGTKTWEPVRSLEVIVEPSTGEPIESLEDIKARGPPAPPAKEKKEKTSHAAALVGKEKKPETIPEEEEEEETIDALAEMPGEQPREPTPAPPPAPVAILKKEPSLAGSRASSVEPSMPAPIIGKKRPAPSTPLGPVSTKKGTAKAVKPLPAPHKKVKLSEEVTTPRRSPSITPVSTQYKTPSSKLKKQTSIASASPTPSSSRAGSLAPEAASPTSSGSTPGSTNDDGEVFCICRKGDNHTWMIACDGGCDEWYHGNCVNIRERDGDLIDKYVCPRCTKVGFQTTWKRMCRRADCRKPARVLADPPSKYCSKECGRMFFVELVRRGDPWIDTEKNDQFVVDTGRTKKLRKKRRKDEVQKKQALPNHLGDGVLEGDSRLATPAYSEGEKSEYETDSSADEDMLPNRGGALRAAEVKALVEKCKTVEQWRELGRKPATPPRETDEKKVEFDDFEKNKLKELEEERSRLKTREDMLAAREKLLELVKVRSSGIAEEVKKADKKLKDVCGFDPRLAWTEEEFLQWWESEGKGALEQGKIGPPPSRDDNDQEMVNGVVESEDEDEEKMPTKGGVCIRNRCPRHRTWQKGQLAELRFEQDVVRKAAGRLEMQERQLRDKAVLREWEGRG